MSWIAAGASKTSPHPDGNDPITSPEKVGPRRHSPSCPTRPRRPRPRFWCCKKVAISRKRMNLSQQGRYLSIEDGMQMACYGSRQLPIARCAESACRRGCCMAFIEEPHADEAGAAGRAEQESETTIAGKRASLRAQDNAVSLRKSDIYVQGRVDVLKRETELSVPCASSFVLRLWSSEVLAIYQSSRRLASTPARFMRCNHRDRDNCRTRLSRPPPPVLLSSVVSQAAVPWLGSAGKNWQGADPVALVFRCSRAVARFLPFVSGAATASLAFFSGKTHHREVAAAEQASHHVARPPR